MVHIKEVKTMLEGIKSMVEAASDTLLGGTDSTEFRDSITNIVGAMTSEELEQLAHLIIKGAIQ